MTEKNLVVQHNQLIESRYKLSVTEQRLIKLLVSMIEPDDEDFKQYVVRVADLANLLGIKSGDIYTAIDKAVDRLMDTPIKFNDGDEKVKVRWLSSSRYQPKKGIALLRFDPELKPLLLQLKEQFTSYQLINIIKLKHIHSIRIYELLKQYEKIGKRRFSIDALRNVLMISDSEYKQYRDFRRWVLKVSQLELSEKTDITFDFVEEREGRSVKFIDFIISHNSKNTILKDNKNIAEITDKKEQENLGNEYVERLVDMGVTRLIAEQLAGEFSKERIDRAISITKEKQKEGHLKNPAAFVVVAIKKDFVDSKAQEKAKEIEILRLQEERERLKKQWEGLRTQYGEWKSRAVEEALLGMTIEEVEEEKRQFMASMNGVIKNAIRKSKESEKRHFLLYLRERLSLDSFDVWARKNTMDLSVFPDDIRRGL